MKKVPSQFIVGSLMYAMVCTRPDIAYPVGPCEPMVTSAASGRSARIGMYQLDSYIILIFMRIL
jgi:hypothetical protein